MSSLGEHWFSLQEWEPHDFQRRTWQQMAKGHSGLLNAATGFGKTMGVWFGILQHYYDKVLKQKNKEQAKAASAKLHSIWITPLRALSKDIYHATNKVSDDLGIDYTVALRTGDTSAADRRRQKTKAPHGMITTPESIHVLLASKGYSDYFSGLSVVVVDEWHELMGSKRGVQVELALSRLKALNPNLIIWGISATIGNLEQARHILLGSDNKGVLVRSQLDKRIDIQTLFPDVLEKFPWAGHLGLKLAEKVIPVIEQANSTLIFTNTRAQAEIWYQHLLQIAPDMAGRMALHHGSISEELRLWVEDALHRGILKVVVCTSSLDLGVDFRPVDTVIQVGSPKGVARFLQRAGRSGHQPGALSTIYFLPTHSLEIMEAASLKYAVREGQLESRIPYIRSFDVLIQYLVTLAVSDGFHADQIYDEVIRTHCFESITREEFNECLRMITHGGRTLDAYEEFHKVVLLDGLYRVTSRAVAHRHLLSIGTIVNDAMMQVKFLSGKYLGSIEEWFISRLKPGDTFWFAGRNLELVAIQHMQVMVRASQRKKGQIPSWQGGRLPISANLGAALRHSLKEAHYSGRKKKSAEISFLSGLFEEQSKRSYLPEESELLIEYIHTRYGYHLFVYPFEGKLVHEGMAAVLAYRLSKIKKATFSIASNEYGFELLCDEPIPIAEDNLDELFTAGHLQDDIQQGVNTTEMAKRRFREIAGIAGLIFQGFPGRQQKTKHLQANSGLFFSVFEDYDRDNLLLRQAYDEVFTFQLEMARMHEAFERIETHRKVLMQTDRMTPFSFPVFAESFREKYSNEDWQSRLEKLKKQLEDQ